MADSQLRAELPLGRRRPRLFHIRDADGRHEVDLVAELSGQQLVAIEIKADAAPRPSAAKHLAWFRDQVGHELVAGAVFHTGRRSTPSATASSPSPSPPSGPDPGILDLTRASHPAEVDAAPAGRRRGREPVG